MNSLKCLFGVNFGKFLEFVIRHRGIEIDQSKIDAIHNMLEPMNLKDLRSYKVARQTSVASCKPFREMSTFLANS